MTNRPFAIVTGGSNGIGLELARQFATGGHDVLIAAEDAGHLEAARRDLSLGGAVITTHASDLATEAGVENLIAAIGGRPVDALCVNAGVGLGGAFTDTDLQAELRMIDLNCRGAVQLTKHVATGMVARGQGRILFTSSVAAAMPDPFEAVYGSTKVFLRWFGQALREELKDTGVTVTVLMPSTTETNFFRRARMMDTKAGTMKKDDAATVAKAGYAALMAGDDHVVPTFKNKLMALVSDTIPQPLAAKMHRGLSEPGTARDDEGSHVVPLAVGAAAVGLGVALFAGWKSQQRRQRDDGRPAELEAAEHLQVDEGYVEVIEIVD